MNYCLLSVKSPRDTVIIVSMQYYVHSIRNLGYSVRVIRCNECFKEVFHIYRVYSIYVPTEVCTQQLSRANL